MAAAKGKIKVINAGSGGIITNAKGDVEYEFVQPNHKELCLNEGDNVKFTLLPKSKRTGITEPTVVNVERIMSGTIASVNTKGVGTLIEKQSEKKIPFFHPYAKEAGIAVGDVVRYKLIATERGELAVNLTDTSR